MEHGHMWAFIRFVESCHSSLEAGGGGMGDGWQEVSTATDSLGFLQRALVGISTI